MSDVTLARLEIGVTAGTLEERRRLTDRGNLVVGAAHVELVLVTIPAGSRW